MPDIRAFLEQEWPSLQQDGLLLPRPNPTFRNPRFEAASRRVLIVRLSPFRDVDRSTPHLFLFQALRRALPEVYIDMAFMPPRHDRERLMQAGAPLLYGCQSFRPLEDFDLVLISNSYVLELVNLPFLLLHSGVPLLASQRDDHWPPLIVGGSSAMACQALITPAGDSLVDALFFGEGEGLVERMVDCLSPRTKAGKHSLLSRAASQVTGLWVAGRWPDQPVEKAVLARPDASTALVDTPLMPGEEAGTARLQISMGCPAFCSFCFESYDRRPYREVDLADLLESARRIKQTQGSDTLELYSFNFNTHRSILDLLLELNRLFARVSLKSQRVDALHAVPGLLEAEVAADKRVFTLGIEGISARLRAWLHKSLASDVIEATLERLLQQKIREMKLFYILTGHEEERDLAEFRDFLRLLKALRRRHNPGVRIIFSFGPLVRMPFTPLRYDRLFLDPGDWQRNTGPVKSACETNGFEFRLATGWEETCTSQVLAMGGYWLHQPLTALAEQGHCFDGQLTPGYWDALRDWMMTHGQWTQEFLGEKDEQYPFALDFVRSNVPASFLLEQYRQAQQCRDEGHCLGTAVDDGRCLGCGACTSDEQRRAITARRPHAADNERYLAALRQVMRTKQRLRPVYVRLRLPPTVAGACREWVNAWVLRGLLGAHRGQTDNLLSAQESLFTTRENRNCYGGFYGETVFALRAWDTAALLKALKAPTDGPVTGPEFLSIVEGFEPGRFRRVRMSLRLAKTDFPDAGLRLRDFLRAQHVPCNTRREGSLVRFDLPARSLKKRVLLAGSCEEEVDSLLLDLQVGPRFDLLAYLRSFGEPERHRAARVRLSDIEW